MTREEQEWKPLTFDEAYERVRQKLITEEMTYKEKAAEIYSRIIAEEIVSHTSDEEIASL